MHYHWVPKFSPYGSVCCACAQVPGLPRVCHSGYLACLSLQASSAQRSRCLRSTRAAVPVLLAHAEGTITLHSFQLVQNLDTPTVRPCLLRMRKSMEESASAMECDVASSSMLRDEIDLEDDDDSGGDIPPPVAAVATSTVQQGQTAATFTIERPATIARFVSSQYCLCVCCHFRA